MSNGRKFNHSPLSEQAKPLWVKVLIGLLVVAAILFAANKANAQTTTSTPSTDVTIAALTARLEKAEAVAAALSAQLALSEVKQPENPAMPNPILFESAPACLEAVTKFLSPSQAAKFCLDARRIERNRAETASKSQRPVIAYGDYGSYGGGGYYAGSNSGVVYVPASRSLGTPAYSYSVRP